MPKVRIPSLHSYWNTEDIMVALWLNGGIFQWLMQGFLGKRLEDAGSEHLGAEPRGGWGSRPVTDSTWLHRNTYNIFQDDLNDVSVHDLGEPFFYTAALESHTVGHISICYHSGFIFRYLHRLKIWQAYIPIYACTCIRLALNVLIMVLRALLS